MGILVHRNGRKPFRLPEIILYHDIIVVKLQNNNAFARLAVYSYYLRLAAFYSFEV
ncbi:MAG: hypothetical protein IKZ88_01445 [Neisseriaceae bacterium]|nr:hypothetical protein [Neisseriaceae bacterium]